MRKPRKVRIVPIVSTKKGHEGAVTGWHVHPDDRAVRSLPKPKTKPTEEELKDGG